MKAPELKATPLESRGTGNLAPAAPLGRPSILYLLLSLAVVAVFWRVGRHDFVNYDDPDYVSSAHVQAGLGWANTLWAFTTGFASNWHPLTWLSHMLDCQLFGQQASGHHLVSALFHLANTLLLFTWLRQTTGAVFRSALVAALFALHPLHVESVAWASERKDMLSAFFFFLTLIAYSKYAAGRGNSAAAVSAGSARYYVGALAFFTLGLLSKPMLVTTPFVLLLLDYWPLRRFRIPGPQPRPGPDATPGNTAGAAADAGKRKSTSAQERPVPGKPAQRRDAGLRSFSAAAPAGAAPGDDGRTPERYASAPGLDPTLLARLVREKLPFLALSIISSVITFVVQRQGGAVSSLGTLSVGARLANALVAYVRYLGKMFLPQDLAVLYPHPGHWAAWQVTASVVVLVAGAAGVLVLARRQPYLAVGWFWYLGTLVPVIGLVQVGLQSMADRYTYLPLIGVFVMGVWGAADLVARTQWRNEAAILGTAVSLAACSFLTIAQLRYWQNSESLFRHAARVTSGNFLAYNNLGFYLSGQGKVDEAMENYRRALEINPAYEDAHNNLGYALAGKKQYTEAIGHYEVALRIRPRHVEVHNNLGNALADTGRTDDAIAHYLFVLQEKPDHADAHNNLGIALAMKGKLEEAIPHFQAAIRFKTNYASAHSNLGNALAAQHKLADAIEQYQECLRLNPKDAQAHNNLGNVLSEQGKLTEAIAQYEEALRLNTDNPEAQMNLGTAFARLGKRAEAIAHFTEAIRLRPPYPEAQQQLNLLKATSPNP